MLLNLLILTYMLNLTTCSEESNVWNKITHAIFKVTHLWIQVSVSQKKFSCLLNGLHSSIPILNKLWQLTLEWLVRISEFVMSTRKALFVTFCIETLCNYDSCFFHGYLIASHNHLQSTCSCSFHTKKFFNRIVWKCPNHLIFSYIAVQVHIVPLKSFPNTFFHNNKAHLIEIAD